MTSSDQLLSGGHLLLHHHDLLLLRLLWLMSLLSLHCRGRVRLRGQSELRLWLRWQCGWSQGGHRRQVMQIIWLIQTDRGRWRLVGWRLTLLTLARLAFHLHGAGGSPTPGGGPGGPRRGCLLTLRWLACSLHFEASEYVSERRNVVEVDMREWEKTDSLGCIAWLDAWNSEWGPSSQAAQPGTRQGRKVKRYHAQVEERQQLDAKHARRFTMICHRDWLDFNCGSRGRQYHQGDDWRPQPADSIAANVWWYSVSLLSLCQNWPMTLSKYSINWRVFNAMLKR